MIHELYPGLKLPFRLSQEGKKSYSSYPVQSLRKNRPSLHEQSPASPVRGSQVCPLFLMYIKQQEPKCGVYYTFRPY